MEARIVGETTESLFGTWASRLFPAALATIAVIWLLSRALRFI